jgi:antitoxin ParD1/3/4
MKYRCLQENSVLALAERWLRDEVAPVYDAMNSDSKRGVPARKVFDGIRDRHERSLKAKV